MASSIDQDVDYKCMMCGRVYNKQRNNFPASHSHMYKYNGHYLPVCNGCVDSMLERYIDELKDDAQAVRRICMKFDIYWNEDLFRSVQGYTRSGTLVRAYISRTNLYKFSEKTYDDTLAEEAKLVKAAEIDNEEREVSVAVIENTNPNKQNEEDVSQDDIDFWGHGFSKQEYDLLNKKYKRWIDELPADADVTAGMEALYRQICILEITINRNTANNKPTEQAINQLNNLIGSVNAKPIQKKQDEAAESPFDSQPFGVGIRMCENTAPIPKPLPQFEDVDGVVRYITIWFFGHLCKMLHIKNSYCKMYDDEMQRLRIERPDLDNEDDETLFNNIFGDEMQ